MKVGQSVIIAILLLLSSTVLHAAVFPIVTSSSGFPTPSQVKLCNGHLYVVGKYTGNVTLGTRELIGDESYSRIFIAKYTDQGGVLWAVSAGGDKSNGVTSLDCSSDGGVYVVGFFSNNATFGAQTLESENTRSTNQQYTSLFIAKYDNAGNVVWIYHPSAGHYQIEVGQPYGPSIAVGSSAMYVVGVYKGVMEFDGTNILSSYPDSSGIQDTTDVFLLRFALNGGLEWVASVSGPGNEDAINSVVCMADGSVTIAGNMYAPTYFDVTNVRNPPIYRGQPQMYVANYNSLGAVNTVVTGEQLLGITGNEISYQVHVLRMGGDGDVYLSVVYQLDSGQRTRVMARVQVPSGNVLWMEPIGCCYFSAMYIDQYSNVFVSGEFSGQVTIGSKVLFAQSSSDIAYFALDSTGQVQWVKQAGGIGPSQSTAIVANEKFALIAGSFTSGMKFESIYVTQEKGMFITSVNKTDGYLEPRVADVVSLALHSNVASQFNRRLKLKVSATISPISLTRFAAVQWKCFKLDPSLGIYELVENLEMLTVENTTIGWALNLKPSVLEPLSSYKIQAIATYTIAGLSSATEARLIVDTFPIPMDPVLDVSRASSTVQDSVSLTVTNAGTTNVQYCFYFYEAILRRGILLRPCSRNHVLRVYLPSGYETSERILVGVIARNSGGDYSASEVTIRVLLNDVDLFALCSTWIENLNLLEPFPTLIVVARHIYLIGEQASSLLDSLFSKIANVQIVKDDYRVWLDFLDILTLSFKTQVSTETMSTFLNMLLQIAAVIEEESMPIFAQIVANIPKAHSLRAVTALSKVIVKYKLPNERPTILVTSNYEIRVFSQAKLLFEKRSVQSKILPDVSVTLPALKDLDDEYLGLSVAFFPKESGLFTFSNDTDTASVADVTFFRGNSTIALRDLADPILITLNHNFTNPEGSLDESGVSCVYFNETTMRWQTDGCYMVQLNVSGTVTCACNHTTSFSAQRVYSSDYVANKPLAVTAIVISIHFLIICVVVLTMLIASRRSQPTSSRFLMPYIGIGAIVIDSILQGIVHNSLLVSPGVRKEKVNIVGHITSSIANPISILAFLMILLQYIRFLGMKRLYTLLAKHQSKGQMKLLKILRLLTSKLLYIAIVSTITTAMFIIFVSLAIAIQAKSEAANNYIAWSISRSVTFAVIFMTISAAVVVVFVADFIMSLRPRTMETKLLSTSGEVVTLPARMTLSQMLHWHFVKDDPLMFRAEALFQCAMVVVLFIYYSVSIGQLHSDNVALGSIQLVLEIAFTLLKIISFGGFVACVGVLNMLRNRRRVQSASSDPDILMDVLHNEYGYEIFFNYAQAEFSLENVLIWKDIEHLKSVNASINSEERTVELNRLMDTYLSRNSEREVNISSKVKQSVLETCKQNDISAEDFDQVLTKLQASVINNLSDTLTRLTKTTEYKRYLQSKQIHLELQRSLNVSDPTVYYAF